MFAINPTTTKSCIGSGSDGNGGVGDKLLQYLQDYLRVTLFRSKSTWTCQSPTQIPNVAKEAILPYGLPTIDLVEP